MERAFSLILSSLLLMLLTPSMLVASSTDKTLNYGIYAIPFSLDPAFGTIVADHIMEVNVFEGLTTYDEDGKVAPGAAHTWEVTADGLRYTFHLRKGLRWSDGSPLVAKSFADTVYRVHQAKKKNLPIYHYSFIKNSDAVLKKEKPLSALGVRVVDDLTIQFELTQPAAFFPALLVTAALPTPKALLEHTSVESFDYRLLVSNGAYKVVAHDKQRGHFQLIKNPFYRLNNQVYYEKINAQWYKNPNQAFFKMASGQLDVYDRYAGSQLTAVQDSQVQGVSVVKTGAPIVDYIMINMREKALVDKRIRKALFLALDHKAMMKALSYTPDMAAYSLAPAFLETGWQPLAPPWGDASLKERRQEALSLMKAAGYGPANRLKLEYLVSHGDSNYEAAELVWQQWKTIGVDIKIIVNSTAVHYEEYLQKSKFQLGRAGWGAVYQDPLNFFVNLHRSAKFNFGGWDNVAYSDEVDYLQQQPLTPKQRVASFTKLEKIIQQEVPIIPLYYGNRFALVAKHIDVKSAHYLLWRHFKPKAL